jgi:hypothetical protein
LALIAGTSANPGIKNTQLANEYLDLADDFGKNHENLYVRARLLEAAGKTSMAGPLLDQAAQEDGLGFGRSFYRKEKSRIQGRRSYTGFGELPEGVEVVPAPRPEPRRPQRW